MKKNAYADTTIESVGKRLRHLQAHCNMKDPENVKDYIANKQCGNAYKESLIEAYAILMKSVNREWQQPFYKRYDKLPKIPSTEQINMLISNACPRMALFLTLSRDLGTRPIELTWLKIRDIDLKKGIVNITSAKHCNGRALKMKKQTLEMLKVYIVRKELNQNDNLFPTKSENVSTAFRRLRNALAKKLQDPTLQQIRLYDFRHYFASMLYYKTKDILYVKQQLGHKDLRQTLRYTQLVAFNQEDEWHCKTAITLKELKELIEAGFEYITEIDGRKVLRKRK